MRKHVELIGSKVTDVNKRHTLRQTLALALFSGAVGLGLSGAAGAQGADKSRGKPKRTAAKFLAEFNKQFAAEYKKHGGEPAGPPGIAPPWLHKLLDAVWDYFA